MSDAAQLTAVPANAYRQRILDAAAQALEPYGPLGTALDFGSGDGFFASQLPLHASIGAVTAVDVVERERSFVKPRLYAGDRLPFSDRSFDLVYAVDVLHHCPDPLAALADMARCTRRFLLLKDHNEQGWLGRWVLAVLDELGNRRFGIPSPHRYQHDWAWVRWIESQGFERRSWLHPMACHRGLLAGTNQLQFMALWERRDV